MDLPEAADNLQLLQDNLPDMKKYFPFQPSPARGSKTSSTRPRQIREVRAAEAPEPEEEVVQVDLQPPKEESFSVHSEAGFFVVRGTVIERLVAMTDFDNPEAVHRLQRAFQKSGIEKELKKQGIKEGDTVQVAGFEFEYREGEGSGRPGTNGVKAQPAGEPGPACRKASGMAFRMWYNRCKKGAGPCCSCL
jgi:GTPase